MYSGGVGGNESLCEVSRSVPNIKKFEARKKRVFLLLKPIRRHHSGSRPTDNFAFSFQNLGCLWVSRILSTERNTWNN